MQKLYKYRPYSDFLFKELFYQELYFASYSELNDPLDLSARMEFTPKDTEQIENLLWYIFKTSLKIDESGLSNVDKLNNQRLIQFNHNEELRSAYKEMLFKELSGLASQAGFVSVEDLENVLFKTKTEIPFQIDIVSFRGELRRLTERFLQNSCATCFSEVNNDFLMWSHYASKHSGICLEFTLENRGLFPHKITGRRNANHEAYVKRISKWTLNETIIWESIKKVAYQEAQPYINFFEFCPVFNNEYDCDLIGLSKSWTHPFAYKLSNIFSTKTVAWQYEKEWRAIRINFGDKAQPEERISHYPIECLTAVFFGIRTSEAAKRRIFKILSRLNREIEFFDCVTEGGRDLTFKTWEYFDD